MAKVQAVASCREERTLAAKVFVYREGELGCLLLLATPENRESSPVSNKVFCVLAALQVGARSP